MHDETRWATRYDELLEAGHEPPTPCPLCTGDLDAEPCDEDCAKAISNAHVHGLYRHADRCLAFARLYQAQDKQDGSDPANDHRIVSILKEIKRTRDEIRVIRWALTPNESFVRIVAPESDEEVCKVAS